MAFCDFNPLFQDISFSLDEYQNDIGCNKLQSNDKTELLMKRWRYPTLSLHGIEGAYSDQGAKTVIPRKVILYFFNFVWG